jgi:hypothetical protein
MSDNSVFITGIAEGAFDQIPRWATEKAVEDLGKILLRIEKNTKGSGSGNGSPADDLDIASKQKKLDKEAVENSTTLGKLAKKTNKLFESLNTQSGRLLLSLTLLDVAMGKIWSAVKENAEMYDQLYKAGISVVDVSAGTTSGFQSLAMAANYSSMTVRDFGAILEAYSGANAVGALKFAKSLPETQKNLAKFGYDLKGAAEVTGAYLDSMMGVTDMQNKSAEEITDGAIEFGKSISALSIATGMSRKQLLQQTAAIAASTDANVIAAASGSRAALSASAFAASFKDQRIGQDFLKMMSSKLPALNDTFQNFVKGGIGGIGSQLSRFSKSLVGMDPEEAEQKTKQFVDSLGNLDAVIQQQQLLAEAGNQNAAENVKTLVGLQQHARSIIKKSDADIAQSKKANAALNEFKNQWGRLTSIFSRTFYLMIPVIKAATIALSILNPVLDFVADGFRLIGEGIDYFSDAVGYVTDLISDFFAPMVNYISGAFNDLSESTNPLVAGFRTFGSAVIGVIKVTAALGIIIGSVVLAFTSLKGMLTIIPALKNMFSGGSLVGRIGGGVLNLLRNVGAAIFGRIGSMISGVFSKIGGIFTSVGGIALKILGVVGWLYTAFEVGYAIGEQLYKIVSNFDWFNNLMDKVFGGLDKLLQYIPGSTGSDAKDRIKSREQLEAANIAGVTATPIAAATKEPAPSTIKSTSAVPSNPEAANKTAASGTKEPTNAPGSGIERPASSGDINNLLSYQSSIMEQLLQSNKELLSVNKDILKITRTQ